MIDKFLESKVFYKIVESELYNNVTMFFGHDYGHIKICRKIGSFMWDLGMGEIPKKRGGDCKYD